MPPRQNRRFSNRYTKKTHKVRRDEDVFKISERYGVSTQELLRANPELKFVRSGQVVRIPQSLPEEKERRRPRRRDRQQYDVQAIQTQVGVPAQLMQQQQIPRSPYRPPEPRTPVPTPQQQVQISAQQQRRQLAESPELQQRFVQPAMERGGRGQRQQERVEFVEVPFEPGVREPTPEERFLYGAAGEVGRQARRFGQFATQAGRPITRGVQSLVDILGEPTPQNIAQTVLGTTQQPTGFVRDASGRLQPAATFQAPTEEQQQIPPSPYRPPEPRTPVVTPSIPGRQGGRATTAPQGLHFYNEQGQLIPPGVGRAANVARIFREGRFPPIILGTAQQVLLSHGWAITDADLMNAGYVKTPEGNWIRQDEIPPVPTYYDPGFVGGGFGGGGGGFFGFGGGGSSAFQPGMETFTGRQPTYFRQQREQAQGFGLVTWRGL